MLGCTDPRCFIFKNGVLKGVAFGKRVKPPAVKIFEFFSLQLTYCSAFFVQDASNSRIANPQIEQIC